MNETTRQTPTVRFFFDFISPYAYLGWTRIHAVAARTGHAVEPVPVLFAALLNHHGTKGPAEVPARRRYLIKDVARLAHKFGVPIDAPPAHPFNPLLALRLASLPMAADQRRALIDTLYAAVWRDRRGVTDPLVLRGLLGSLGLPSSLLQDAESDAAKQRVREQTEAAIALGVFGVPTAAIDGELFWGCDSLPHLENYLRGEDPAPSDLVERWENLPSQAWRPGAGR